MDTSLVCSRSTRGTQPPICSSLSCNQHCCKCCDVVPRHRDDTEAPSAQNAAKLALHRSPAQWERMEESCKGKASAEGGRKTQCHSVAGQKKSPGVPRHVPGIPPSLLKTCIYHSDLSHRVQERAASMQTMPQNSPHPCHDFWQLRNVVSGKIFILLMKPRQQQRPQKVRAAPAAISSLHSSR